MAAATRSVKMIAPTYVKGVIADVGTTLELAAATASEFVSHGRAYYTIPGHGDVQPPPATAVTLSVAPDDAVSIVVAPAPLGLKAKADKAFA